MNRKINTGTAKRARTWNAMSRSASPNLDPVREVYDGRTRLGFIRQNRDGQYEARDSNDTLIGGFSTEGEVVSAVSCSKERLQ
jgi:hypothetical protein